MSTKKCTEHLCDELNNATGLLDLALSVFAEVPGPNDYRDFWDAALAENFAVAEREEVKDRRGVGALVGEVLLALLERDKGPELVSVSKLSTPRAIPIVDDVSHTLSRLMTGFQN
jgi:hypothetical protein